VEEVRAAFGGYAKSKAKIIVGDKDDDEKDKLLVASLLALREEMEKCVGGNRVSSLSSPAHQLGCARGTLCASSRSHLPLLPLLPPILPFPTAARSMVKTCFGGQEAFQAAVKTGIEVAVNSRDNRPAELIARFVDGRMRGGAKGAGSEAELERDLDRVMLLFKCVHGKDVFEAFYKKDLAKRLLLGRSSSLDLEKAMVSRLKTECGSQFTAKLEGMFRDMDAARELHSQYLSSKHAAAAGPAAGAAAPSSPTKTSSSSAAAAAASSAAAATSPGSPLLSSSSSSSSSSPPPAPVDLIVSVLTSAHWPTYTFLPVILPPELDRHAKAFAAFYSAKYNGNRVLTWQHGLGHCVLRASFPSGGKKELDVSLSQTLVLLLFNEADAVPFPDIKAASGMEDAELRRTLQSLACGQVRVLRKEPKGREVEDGDVFHFNAAFTAPLFRVKINQIQMKETKQEVDATNERVFQDRQYQVDAALVRIMKSRKSLPHQTLLAELFAQLRFPAKAADVTKRINSLIEREYLERDEDDENVYRYLA
jgi:cullin 4